VFIVGLLIPIRRSLISMSTCGRCGCCGDQIPGWPDAALRTSTFCHSSGKTRRANIPRRRALYQHGARGCHPGTVFTTNLAWTASFVLPSSLPAARQEARNIGHKSNGISHNAFLDERFGLAAKSRHPDQPVHIDILTAHFVQHPNGSTWCGEHLFGDISIGTWTGLPGASARASPT